MVSLQMRRVAPQVPLAATLVLSLALCIGVSLSLFGSARAAEAEIKESFANQIKDPVPGSVLGAEPTCAGLPAAPVRVIRCYDGDTCTLADKTKVRLAGIDAPEKKGTMGGKGQAGSDDAAMALRERLVGKEGIVMAVHDRDRYGRAVGEFCIGGKSVNVEMVREGFALAYRGKVKTKTIAFDAFASAETEAKSSGKGIWALGPVQGPGAYRKILRAKPLEPTE